MENKNDFLKSLNETDKKKISDYLVSEPKLFLEFLNKIHQLISENSLIDLEYCEVSVNGTPLSPKYYRGESDIILEHQTREFIFHLKEDVVHVRKVPSIIIKYTYPKEKQVINYLEINFNSLEKDEIHKKSSLFGLKSNSYQLTILKSFDFFIKIEDGDLFSSINYLYQDSKINLFDFENVIKETSFNLIDKETQELIFNINNLIIDFFITGYKSLNEFKSKSKVKVLDELDQDNNGQLDFIEGGDDYLPLLKKHQSKIIEIDRTYIQQFIKVSNYLTQKKQNLQVIFERLKDSVNQSQLDELGEILKQEIHTYNIILLNSLHMINSLVEDDMITFYEIYEKFDKLNMFTSNWENQVTEKLDEVNLNLVELMKELRDVGDRIVGSIDNLSYITEESTRQLSSKMEEIDSTLKVGNLINVIQTYQMYKVNKNTKSLNN
jgi:hypothetical protein